MNPTDLALWCLSWMIAATVAAVGGYNIRWQISKPVPVIAAALAWGGLWFHELFRVPQLLGFTPDGDLFKGGVGFAAQAFGPGRPLRHD